MSKNGIKGLLKRFIRCVYVLWEWKRNIPSSVHCNYFCVYITIVFTCDNIINSHSQNHRSALSYSKEIFKFICVILVLKLLKMAKGIRALLDTVIQALPQVGNLVF
jgi:hypothetical protein